MTAARQCAISIGSNIQHGGNFRRGLAALVDTFGALTGSTIYRSAAVGGQGEYWNQVVSFTTPLSAAEARGILKRIERACGRQPASATVTLDLDLLLLGELIEEAPGWQIPHPDILTHDFVYAPLLEVLPDWRHPLLGVPLDALPDTARPNHQNLVEIVPPTEIADLWEPVPCR